MTRRKFLSLSALALPAAAGANAAWVEPTNVVVRNFTVTPGGSTRFVHFTDFHYKGDDRYAAEVIATINAQAPAFVCFSGDMVEDRAFLPAALKFLRQIQAPVYGTPGNHDYLCMAPFADYECAFAETGGAWLVDQTALLAQLDLEIVGLALTSPYVLQQAPKAARRLLLVHYPAMADRLNGHVFDLILAGHSHGGQVRLPLLGSLILPDEVGGYDLGFYETKGGPLYVGAGIGTYHYPIRFNCPPEITVVTI